MARALSLYKFNSTLRFIGFNAEEDGLRGSRDYVNTEVWPNKESILGVICLDMILRPGWDARPDEPRWLMADPSSGTLMTQLTRAKAGSRDTSPLLSAEAVITDGDWHRIGFVWNYTSRILYVDDVEVARDELENLASSEGGLVIGAGAGLEDNTFWSGLIDDVQIYDRAVEP